MWGSQIGAKDVTFSSFMRRKGHQLNYAFWLDHHRYIEIGDVRSYEPVQVS